MSNQSILINYKKKLYNMLNETVTRGSYSYNAQVQKLLIKIFKKDKNEGVESWMYLLNNFLYIRRTQDFTKYMINLLMDCFGLDWMINLLNENKELEIILFSKAPDISLTFFKNLVYHDKHLIINHYLNLIECNNSYVSIENCEEIKKSPSRYRYLISHAFKLDDKFKNRLSSLQQTDKMKNTIQAWIQNANNKPCLLKPDRINLNEKINKNKSYIPKIMEKSEISRYRTDQLSQFNTLELPSDRLKKLNSLIIEINQTNEMCFVFSESNTKNGYIFKYLASQGDLFLKLPTISELDYTNNYICSFKEGKEFLYYLMCNLTMDYNEINFGYNIFGSSVFDICLHSKYESKYQKYCNNSIIKKYFSHSDNEYKIKAANDSIAFIQNKKLFKNEKDMLDCLGKCLVLPLNFIMQNVSEWTSLHYYDFDIDEVKKYKSDIYNYLVQTGEINSKWVSENEMYRIIKLMYQDAIFQYYAPWLGRQSYDAFIPSEKIAFEYQGIQHYEPIDFFGGEEALKRRKQLDEKKRILSAKNGVRLIEWKYNEPITNATFLRKIRD